MDESSRFWVHNEGGKNCREEEGEESRSADGGGGKESVVARPRRGRGGVRTI